MESVRVDRWLYAARVFKSRSQATQACASGKVHRNGAAVKPSHPVRVRDELHVQSPRGLLILEVRALSERRLSAPLARELYEDRSPPPPPREERAPRRPRGATSRLSPWASKALLGTNGPVLVP